MSYPPDPVLFRKGIVMFDLQAAADVVFLALCIWREARGEPHDAKVAVACSVLNRVDRPSWWGTSITGVLFKKWQYSSLTDPKDRQLTTWPARDPAWAECLTVARDAIEGHVTNPVPGADSYYDTSIPPPKWATPQTFVGQVGRLMFYNVDRDTETVVHG